MENAYKFYTDTISYKTITNDEGIKEYYIEGYISTKDLDRVNDIVTDAALDDMVKQLKTRTIKLDVEHEAWKKSPNIIPVGKIIDARKDDKGVWVKAVLNNHISRFSEVWNSIKSGFLDSFSIAYKAIKAVDQKMGEKIIRLLDKVELLNVAITGNPANPECRMRPVLMKSLDSIPVIEQQIMEENKMSEQTKTEIKEEPLEKVEEVQEQPSEPEAQKEEIKEQPEIKDLSPVIEQLQKELAELKTAKDENAKVVAEMKEKLEAAQKALEKPVLKSIVEEKPLEVKEEKVVTPLMAASRIF